MIQVNQDKCMACGLCVDFFPHIFRMEDKSVCYKQPEESVVEVCPIGAIEDTCEGCCLCK